ncbi:MAG: hypothetical protein WBP12_01910 [Candidatus Saccharimonas sp.]
MTTSSSSEHISLSASTEELTMLQLLRRECGQEYTEEDRRFEAFVTGLISRLETYNQLVKIVEEAERAKHGQVTINPDYPA